MELVRNILMWVSLAAALGMATVCAVVWCGEYSVLPGRRILQSFRRLPWLARIFLVVFVVQFVVHGSTKTNRASCVEVGSADLSLTMIGSTATVETLAQDGCTLLSPTDSKGSPVSDSDIARGYRLESIVTNVGYSFAMPTNGVLCGQWHRRGAYDDITCVDFNGWTFPIGTTAVSRLWAFVNGSVRPAIRDTVHEIAPVGTPLSAIPSVSRLWTAVMTNDARLVTWENFAGGRIRCDELSQSFTNDDRFLSAQLELYANGDFVTRSNALEIAYRRIDQNDWDGDGWHNDDDPEPKRWTGGDFGLAQSLPTNANEVAYCWVDVQSSYNTSVRFVGDGPSDLPDPVFTVRAGTTYRVMLLIGKGYSVESARALTVVDSSSDEVEVEGSGTKELSIRYPVDIYALEGNGREFKMVVSPRGLGGSFSWTNSCCAVYGDSDVFRYGCISNCVCTGCTARGYYAYEGYRLFAEGGWCGCSGVPGDDPDANSPGASVSFSKSVIFLEDAYWNTPTNEVPWQSTDTLLTCDANGGDNGGVVTFTITGGTNLVQYTGEPLPYTRTLAPNETLHFVNRYKATAESATENDIVVTATFVENGTGWRKVSEAKATAVRVEIEPRVTREHAENRHLLGVGEDVFLRTFPCDGCISVAPGVDWEPNEGNMYTCPLTASTNGLIVTINDCSYSPELTVIEPVGVVCQRGMTLSFGDHIGEAGWVGMRLEVEIIPDTVCFSGLAFVEVPSNEGLSTGYFATHVLIFGASHDEAHGAGEWYDISYDNFFFPDCPRIECACPTPWSAGVLNWTIPIAWGKRGTKSLVGKVGEISGNTQLFTINSAGDVRIDKFGQWVSRSPNGTYSHSSGIINAQ